MDSELSAWIEFSVMLICETLFVDEKHFMNIYVHFEEYYLWIKISNIDC